MGEAATMTITREEAETLHEMMTTMFNEGELTQDETALLRKIAAAFDLGRPVPRHGSGGIIVDPK